jgi:glycosyltransferase involved in cell wall biosynthesis
VTPEHASASARDAGPARVTPSEISVVICAYTLERWDLLRAAITSAGDQQVHHPREVILVIDHNDELFERAREAAPSIRVIRNSGPPGLSGGRTTGLHAASGRVVAFLDDDAAADPNWLGAMSGAYDEASVLGVGGSASASWERGRPRWFPEEFDWVVGCSYRGLPTHRAPVRNPIGCNMSFRREPLIRIGGFRSEVGRVGSRPTGGDETELSIRLLSAYPDGRIVYEPQARISHHVPAVRSTWRYFRMRCFAEGVSKAIIARMAGSIPALSTERRYVRRTLPAGMVRGALEALRGRPAGLLRALVIFAGLAVTTAGYIYGIVTRAPLVPRASSDRPHD